MLLVAMDGFLNGFIVGIPFRRRDRAIKVVMQNSSGVALNFNAAIRVFCVICRSIIRIISHEAEKLPVIVLVHV